MEQNFQTSFIPKKPILEQRVVKQESTSILFVISLFILFTVLISTGGLYFYKGVLEKNILQKENDLALAKNSFEPAAITKLQNLDKRLQAADSLLAKHITIIPIFKALEEVTLKTVQYTAFGYSFDTTKDKNIVVTMTGVADSYRSVALQSDLFSKNKNFIDPVFSNLSLEDKTSKVSFNLEFSVDRTFVNYKQNILTEGSSSN